MMHMIGDRWRQREAQPAAVGVVMGEASGNSKSGPATKA
ncbi:unnamed protein product, partial [Musa acuminata subsp. burmannicoides]